MVSVGKGTWNEVSQLIKDPMFKKVFIITSEFGKENFKTISDNTELIIINPELEIQELQKEITTKLKPKLKGPEVAINIISGSGKEHMSLIAAMLNLGLGIRFIALTKQGIKTL